MKRIIIIICFFIVMCGSICSQSLTSSNLPIVIINTDGGAAIWDNPRVLATMKIIYRGPGERNYVTDQNNTAYLNYNGRIDIELRGSSSQERPKKQYGLTTRMADNITNNNVSLLGMPAENDWILNGMIFDPALIRDYLSFYLSRQIGEYASRTVYCEVIINGIYKGLYLLDEKIKADDDRVDVIKIASANNYLPELSGGYITKADKTTGDDPVAWTLNSYYGGIVNYIHELPKPEYVTTQQNNYIHNQFNKLATSAQAGNTSFSTGFPSVIDIPSFINFMIISELSSNADAYQYSTFFHKDRNGKLRAGPIWDNDLTYGNDLFFWGYDRSHTDVWQFSNGDNEGSRFWRDLFNNSQFRCYLSKRWNELIQPGRPLNLTSLGTFIDQTVATISEAVVRENALWGNVGNHAQQIADIKTWLSTRIAWITTNLGSYSACSNVTVPPLVISKIMYNPEKYSFLDNDSDLEFLEITNNSDQTVDLTGIYFSGTGLVYQFPVNSTLAADSSIYLAADTSAFKARYWAVPFDQFTRHLSNNNQNLVLSDAFGNVIDNVHYFDTIPWPDADNNGYYLRLADPDLDNSLAENWTASDELILSDNQIHADLSLHIYPNPVQDVLKIRSASEIRTLSLYDIYGRLLQTADVNSDIYELDMKRFTRGLYLIKVITSDRIQVRKVVKN